MEPTLVTQREDYYRATSWTLVMPDSYMYNAVRPRFILCWWLVRLVWFAIKATITMKGRP